MLYHSLSLSAVLLVLANVAVHRPFGWRPAFFVAGPVLVVYPAVFLWLVLPPVALLFVGLTVAMGPWLAVAAWRAANSWTGPPPRPWLYLPLSAVAVLIAFGVPTWHALDEQREYARLRAEFPFESLEDRRPPRPAVRDASAEEEPDGAGGDRPRALHWIHQTTTVQFVNSPGFGVTRMSYHRSPERLTEGVRPDSPVPQPSPIGSLPEGLALDRKPADNRLKASHKDSVWDFAYPAGFGYVKDRRHVAGFLSHRFSKVPTMPEPLSVQRVELIGLLKHAEPAAYVSANLPRMDELRDAPTRALDEFEADAIARLYQGEELVVATAERYTRMVGAVRSLKQCVACHGGERGDLLGAFSYTLSAGNLTPRPPLRSGEGETPE